MFCKTVNFFAAAKEGAFALGVCVCAHIGLNKQVKVIFS